MLPYYAKNLLEVKAIVESFEGSNILVSQAKVNLQTTGLANFSKPTNMNV